MTSDSPWTQTLSCMRGQFCGSDTLGPAVTITGTWLPIGGLQPVLMPSGSSGGPFLGIEQGVCGTEMAIGVCARVRA